MLGLAAQKSYSSQKLKVPVKLYKTTAASKKNTDPTTVNKNRRIAAGTREGLDPKTPTKKKVGIKTPSNAQ